MAKIAIVSDVHLGTRQYGLKERYDDFLAAFEWFGKNLQVGVDTVVIGGDLFDSPRPDAQSVRVAKKVVEGIKARGINVIGIDGNHDLAGGGWLDVIGAEALGDGVPVKKDGVSITGINYRNGRDLVGEIQRMVDEGIQTDILVMHFALAEMNGGGSSDAGVRELSPMLDKLGVKAVLMGHVHIPDCRKWNGVLYVNPGSTEMKSSNEPQDKFYCILDTETWEATPVPIETRKVVGVEITDEASLVEFREMLEDEAKKVSGGAMTKRPFYQIIADDSIEDGFKRIASIVHDTCAIARIVMRSSKSRDLAPVVDRKESVATLESAIEARFPKDSDEAKLTADFLHSPEPSAIHLNVEKFMGGRSDKS
jgi:DNA repair exonuclease SbcCD nuclease subunit